VTVVEPGPVDGRSRTRSGLCHGVAETLTRRRPTYLSSSSCPRFARALHAGDRGGRVPPWLAG
jgi:hypothetical protein